MSLKALQKKIRDRGDNKIAEHSLRFFKTGKGEYGYGDKFLGIRVPVIRQLVASEKPDLSLSVKISQSKYHEERLFGLLALVRLYEAAKKDPDEQKKVYQAYLKLFPYINNWDLVDVTCHKIIGPYLFERDRKVLYKWARSKDLWTKRISILTTYYFIRKKDLDDTYKISKILLKDKHDLIHKAVGWMLREAGKKDSVRLKKFLDQNASKMPRTMLRYAIERMPATTRKKYLAM